MPRYSNTKGQPREVCMVAAYQLVTDFGATQQAVAEVFKTTQPTIHNWVKEVGYKKEITGLKSELKRAGSLVNDLRQEMGLLEYHPDEED